MLTRREFSTLALSALAWPKLLAQTTVGGVTLLLQVKPFAEAVGAARKRVSVRRNQREADLIGADCTGRTPTEARVLCQSVLDGYMKLRTELRRAEATARPCASDCSARSLSAESWSSTSLNAASTWSPSTTIETNGWPSTK